VVLLPGPPREMKPMFAELVAPRLEKQSRGLRIRKRTLRSSGLGESALDQKIATIYGKFTNPSTTILSALGEVEIRLTAHAETAAAADALLDDLAEQIEDALYPAVFSHAGEPI